MKSVAVLLAGAAVVAADCPDYIEYATQQHAPFSSGKYHLSYQRPDPACRTFNSSIVENVIENTMSQIADPDLKRLFENTYPNTLDTAVKWKGTAAGSDEELTFLITGDINAMWLRDSSNQMQSYLPLLKASNSSDSLASLYRGVVNLHARYLLIDPYCNSFQPPIESGIKPSTNGAASNDNVKPQYSTGQVFECKYEIDSLAAFLEVSTNYYTATQDSSFFKKYQWVEAVNTILQVAQDQMIPTYSSNGSVNTLAYTFSRQTDRASETEENDGTGNPFQSGTGLVRSFFRPSDDSTIFQGFIPGNMMFSRYLASTADIADSIGEHSLASKMKSLAAGIKKAINQHGVVNTPHGPIYAYEVDGYGSQNIMDDANIPSLLSAPFFGFLDKRDMIYQNTRKLLLSSGNPYWMSGPAFTAIGGPHNGPGFGWPMASIMRIATTDDDSEITQQLQQLVSSTDGLGLIHESIYESDATRWTRQWFSWANGLFGQIILDLADRKPHILKQSFQGGGSHY
ncbi:meiotically up-regulated protein [Acrodontium crateriforme]|uniref:Meiotically up-regulated protein n=1 Tax=Acrodontium crateriforme TaxID=150365 RepID=A0AAQ3R299_9PEZI|nr:meiotically up-regulated protein [Acrodontium crateriforme]